MHLTDMSGMANDIDLISDDDDSGDKTIIVRAGSSIDDVEKSDVSTDFSRGHFPVSPAYRRETE